MFGFWFSIFGLFFGVLCSIVAQRKNRTRNDWFILGFIFSFIALILITQLPKVNPSFKINSSSDPFVNIASNTAE